MKFIPITMMTALALAAGGAAAQQGAASKQQPQPAAAAAADAKAAQSMEKLRQSAQHLRESIQAMARKQPGPDRDRAIDQAHQALIETQQAMMTLPPELRRTRTVSSADYDRSVQRLMRAADSLRESIQAMAQQKPGDARNRAIEQAQQALWDTQQAMVSAYVGQGDARKMGAGAPPAGGEAGKAATGGQAKPDKPQGSKTSAAQPGAVLMLVPVQVASDAKLANGCWVRFYDGTNFSGATLTLAGPVEMAQMHPAGNAWRNWDSAIVGPKARVTTFDGENFRERTARLEPGQRAADLKDGELGWFDQVQSARVSCTG